MDRIILGLAAIFIMLFSVAMFFSQVREETTQLEMAKLGYCKYKQGLNPPAFFKCKEYTEK